MRLLQMPRPSLHAKPNILWRLWSEWEGEENPWRSSDATDQCWWACALKPMTAKPPWLLLLLLWGKAIDWKRERWWIERGRGGIYRGERLKRAGVVFGVAIDWKREILMSREGGEVFIGGKGWKDGGCVWCGPLVLLSLSWFGPLEKILGFGAQTIGFVYPVFHVLSPVWDSAAVVFHPIPRFLTRFGHVCHYTQY